MCPPREPRKWLFATCIRATGQAYSCTVQVLSTFHTDWLPSEGVSAWCHMERRSARMCKRCPPAPTTHSACLFIHNVFLSVILTLCKYNQAGQTSGSRCPPPPKLQNGYHKPSPATAGGVEVIEYFCNRPYILGGSQRLTCSSHGSWSGAQPKCVRGSAWVVLEGYGWQNMDSYRPPFPLKFTHSCLLLQPVDSPECQNSLNNKWWSHIWHQGGHVWNKTDNNAAPLTEVT